MPVPFRDRRDAGRQLAQQLAAYANRSDVIVLALPRGGVPVAYEVARTLAAPLDIFLVRKLGVPGHEELAMGALATGGVRILNDDVIESYQIPDDTIDRVAKSEQAELERREAAYRGDRPAPDLHGRTAIVIDDGLATGSTMRAAVAALRRQGPSRIVVAVPVGAPPTCRTLSGDADEVVCLERPEMFWAVGAWYEDFTQTTDEEIQALLASQTGA